MTDSRTFQTTVLVPPPPPPPPVAAPPPPPVAAPPPPPVAPAPVPPPPGGPKSRGAGIVVGVVALLLGVLVAVVVAAIVVSGGEEGTREPTPAAGPAPVRTARLAGDFTVVEKLTSVWGLQGKKVGTTDRITWRFAPRCEKGACAVRLTFLVEDPTDITLNQGFGMHSVAMRLRRSGAVYQGKGTVKLTNCFGTPVAGPMKVWLRVTKGAWVDGVWTATRLRGTVHTSSPESTSGPFVCQASGYTAKLTGSLRS